MIITTAYGLSEEGSYLAVGLSVVVVSISTFLPPDHQFNYPASEQYQRTCSTTAPRRTHMSVFPLTREDASSIVGYPHIVVSQWLADRVVC
jgi:hypothetical protein